MCRNECIRPKSVYRLLKKLMHKYKIIAEFRLNLNAFFSSCLVPAFLGALFSREWNDGLWDKFCTGAPARERRFRRTVQHSQDSLRALSRRYGINPKAVAKWKMRTLVAGLPTGLKEPHSTVLSLDDYLYAPQATIPHLTLSSLHCCL